MNNDAINLKQKAFIIITGASRGIGQATAIELARCVLADSKLLLLARNIDGLKNTQQQILQINSQINVDIQSIDLTRPTIEELEKSFKKSLCDFDLSSIAFAMIIHNVGTLGDVKTSAKNLNDSTVWHNYYDMNVFSIIRTNSIFMKLFSLMPKIIVNITSLCAIKPFDGQALYCTARSAREMFFKVFASEEKNNSTFVLNYSPGPVETDMTIELQSDSLSMDIREMFMNLRKTNTILSPQQTAKKMIEVLLCGQYETGSHVDYYDKLEKTNDNY